MPLMPTTASVVAHVPFLPAEARQLRHRRVGPPADARLRAVVAVPARDEEGEIGRCLAALAAQRRSEGGPFPAGSCSVAVVLNNCVDRSFEAAVEAATRLGLSATVLEILLPPPMAHAGWARRVAMDVAAAIMVTALPRDAGGGGVVLTTDADSAPRLDWLAASLRALAAGADIVAGTIENVPEEFARLAPACRWRAERTREYVELLDRLATLVDPEPHDPWPRHPFRCGASIALPLGTYLAVGGLPPLPSGEDRALFAAVLRAGGRVRHAPDVRVVTSCRTEGRARGGMADTLVRWSGEGPPNPEWDEIDGARSTARMLALRARLRAVHAMPVPAVISSLSRRLRLPPGELAGLLATPVFARVEEAVRERSQAYLPARVPAERLPAEIAVARALVARHLPLRGRTPAQEVEAVALVA